MPELPGVKPEGLIMKAELILNDVTDYPDDTGVRRIKKAMALIELAKAKIALLEYNRTR